MTKAIKPITLPLTQAMREEFVNNVTGAIVTKIDEEPLRKAMQEEALAQLPAKVREIYENPALRPYLRLTTIYTPAIYRARNPKTHASRSVSFTSVVVYGREDFQISAKLTARIKAAMQASADKLDAKEAMHEKLTAMVRACKNTGDLEEMFPSLVEHIPERAKKVSSNVPAVLIRDTVQELRKLGVPALKAKA